MLLLVLAVVMLLLAVVMLVRNVLIRLGLGVVS